MSDKKYLPISENEEEEDDDDLGLGDIGGIDDHDDDIIINIAESEPEMEMEPEPDEPEVPDGNDEPTDVKEPEPTVINIEKNDEFDDDEEELVTDAFGEDMSLYFNIPEDGEKTPVPIKEQKEKVSISQRVLEIKEKIISLIPKKKEKKTENASTNSQPQVDIFNEDKAQSEEVVNLNKSPEEATKEKKFDIKEIGKSLAKKLVPILLVLLMMIIFGIMFKMAFSKEKDTTTETSVIDVTPVSNVEDNVSIDMPTEVKSDEIINPNDLLTPTEDPTPQENIREENPTYKVLYMGEDMFLYNSYKQSMVAKSLWVEYNEEVIISRTTFEKKMNPIVDSKEEFLNNFESDDVKNYFYSYDAEDYYNAILLVLKETHQRDVDTLKFVTSDNGNRTDALAFIKLSEAREKELLTDARIELINYLKNKGVPYKLGNNNKKYEDYHVPLRDIFYTVDQYLD